MLNSNTKHPDEAWDFLKFAAGVEGQKILAISGGKVPSIIELMVDADVDGVNPHFSSEGFQNILKNATARPILPYYSDISNIIEAEIYSLITSRVSAEQAVSNIETRINRFLNQNK